MKKILLTAMFGMFAVAGFSQLKWDAKVGMSMTNLTGDMDGDMKVGYAVGVGMDYSFSDAFSLQSGLNFTGKGTKDEGVKVKMNYIELPVLAAYKFSLGENMKFVVNAGPYLAVGLGGKITADGSDEDVKLFSKEDGAEEAIMKRFDMGIQYGIGLEVGEHYLVNLTGQNGFINTLNKDFFQGKDVSSKNMAFYISVGYRF